MANIPEPLTRLESILAAILYSVSNGDYGYVPDEDPTPPAPDGGDSGDVDNGGGENDTE